MKLADTPLGPRDFAVERLTADQKWKTLAWLARNSGYQEASVSCGLRTLRAHDRLVQVRYWRREGRKKIFLYRVTKGEYGR